MQGPERGFITPAGVIVAYALTMVYALVMKKILAIITAVFLLTACGPEAPEAVTPTKEPTGPEAEYNKLEDAWVSLTDNERERMCLTWHLNPTDSLALFEEFGADPTVVGLFFNANC